MNLKAIFKLKLKYYNFGSMVSSTSLHFDHYPSEEEMMEAVREYEKTIPQKKFKLELSVDKIYQVKR